ncbi:MAG: hypothetical protein GX589_10485, partial [Deltaproteobacteria bacterium]|nr:hypothetical protein [Deltaproteobacteria bacterium]
LAESALDSLTSIVIRLQELAEQSANGVYGTVQRKSLDAEAQALSKEYFRISKSVKFNGLNLFDGSVEELRLQAGYGLDGGVASVVGGAIGTGSFGVGTFLEGLGGEASVGLRDLNGDGALDMVMKFGVLIGNGDGTFGAKISFGEWGMQASAVGDLNGDGVPDIVAKKAFSLNVLLGVGDGTFTSLDFGLDFGGVGSGGVANSVVLEDLNGDGVLDMVENLANSAGVRIGNGDGTFGERTTFQLGDSSNGNKDVTLGDLNGDGVLDIVSANHELSKLSVLIGNGDGTFGARTHLSAGNFPTSVVLGDLNGDSILDLVTVVGTSSTSSATVRIGKGDGTFSAATTIELGGGPSSVSLGDLNGDGVLDMVAAVGTAFIDPDPVIVLIGNGNGTFSVKTSYAVGKGISPVVTLGDLNGDGVLDISTTGSNNCVLLAQTTPGVSPLLPFSLSTMADARQALPVFQQKLSQLGAQRGQIGAFQSRLSVAVNVLSSSTENIAAATGRIRDADVAKESANLVRNQILQQAGAAVLAQANQQSALVLKLLDSN